MRRHLAWILILGISGCQSWKTFWLAGLNVTSITPASGATGVAVFASVTVNFNQTLESSTVSAATISLVSAAGTVDATLTLSGSTVTLKPKSYLAAGTDYFVRITTDLKGAGNTSLSDTSNNQFTTMAANSFVSHVGTTISSDTLRIAGRFSDGSYAITGYLYGNANAMQSASGTAPLSGYGFQGGTSADCFLGRFKTDGTVMWYVFIGANAQTETCVRGVVTKDDGVAVVGKVPTNVLNLSESLRVSDHRGSNDGFVAKFSNAGQLQWWGFYGGTGSDDAMSIAEDSQGNIIATFMIVGSGISVNASKQVLGFQGAMPNTGVVKISPSGVLQWYTHFGDPASAGGNPFDAVVIGSDDSVYIAGQGTQAIANYGGKTPLVGPSSLPDGVIAKYDSAGVFQWYTYVGGGGSENLKSGAALADGNLVFAGDAGATFTYQGLSTSIAHGGGTDAFVYSCTPAGTTQWFHFFGGVGTDQTADIQAARDGGYALLMTTASTFSILGKSPVNTGGGGLGEFMVARFSASRQFQWHTVVGSNGFEQPKGIIEGNDGGWLLVGDTDTALTGPSGKPPVYSYSSTTDGAYIKIKADGSF